MQRVIENFPEFKKSERNTTKHFNILEELRRLIEGRSLYKISEVEQDLSSTESSNSKGDNYRKVCNIIESDDFSKVEKLRLLILFSIRYENDNMIFQLKEKMRGQGISEEQLNLVNCMLEYAGKNQRRSDLFNDKSGWQNSKKLFTGMFSDVENVLLQHKPLTSIIVDQLMKGKLSSQEYPATIASFDPREKPEQLIIFMVGGTTYEEA